jgi:hypothetical protein
MTEVQKRRLGVLGVITVLRRDPERMLPLLLKVAPAELHPLLERAAEGDNGAVTLLLAWIERGGAPLH